MSFTEEELAAMEAEEAEDEVDPKTLSYDQLWNRFCKRWENNEENGNTSDLWEVASDFFDYAYECGKREVLDSR